MNRLTSVNDPQVAIILNEGGIGIIRTDTLYGIIARADDETAVSRVYALKGRDENKSPIVLIDAINMLYDEANEQTNYFLQTVWPGAISVILPSKQAPHWIMRGNNSVAYRLPANASLRTLVAETGPLIAPSANPQGLEPALNIQQAQLYFGEAVDFYVDGGTVVDAQPSQLLRIDEAGEVTRLR